VSVPIGHPDDITLRALRVLREATLIASEDPGATQALLGHHRIPTAVTSYGPANIKEKVALLIHRLLKGARIAIVADSGSPVIADPGQLLISKARTHGIEILSIPGPSALTAAFSSSGFSGDSFFFQGSLPDTKAALKRCLVRIVMRAEHTVAFCASNSLPIILETIKQLAPRRFLVLASDLTKPGESVIRGTAQQIHRLLSKRPAPQDVTIIVAGKKE
jgi:16S rRNA (cytidine1402-2'-O)-methyltransferase